MRDLVKEFAEPQLAQDRLQQVREHLRAVAANAATHLEGEGGDFGRQKYLLWAAADDQRRHVALGCEHPHERVALFCAVAARLKHLERVVKDTFMQFFDRLVRPLLSVCARVVIRFQAKVINRNQRIDFAVELVEGPSLDQGCVEQVRLQGGEHRVALGVRFASRGDVGTSPLFPEVLLSRLFALHRLDDVGGEHGKVQLDGRASRPRLHWIPPGRRLRCCSSLSPPAWQPEHAPCGDSEAPVGLMKAGARPRLVLVYALEGADILGASTGDCEASLHCSKGTWQRPLLAVVQREG